MMVFKFILVAILAVSIAAILTVTIIKLNKYCDDEDKRS